MANETKDKAAKVRRTTPAVVSLSKNKIRIFGDNVLYNNGIITAFYILPLKNYSTSSSVGIEQTVVELTSIIKNLYISNPTVEFTIERIDKVIKKKDVLSNLIGTISMYKPEYDMPPEFTNNVKDDLQSYCLLGIDIQQSTIENIDDYSIKDTFKSLAKQAINMAAGLGNLSADPEKILKLETNVYNAIRDKCVRASKDLVFYSYVSKLYPCYEISYDKLSYINENNFEDILGAVTQTVSDNFGWFEMHNEGVDFFDLMPQITYGCMVDIKSFPKIINSSNFAMNGFPRLVTSIKTLKKEDAVLQIKRIRSADRFTADQAIEAGAEIEVIERLGESISIATMALEDVEEKDEILCQFNTSMLITATDIDTLKQYIAEVTTSCKDRNILISKSLTQALDFLNNYVNKKPKKYEHMANIAFPLSFQQNAGAAVGDTDEIWSPAIGEDIS